MATFNIDVIVSNRGAVAGVQAVDRQLGVLNRTVSTLQNAFVGLFAVQQITQFLTGIGRVAEGFNQLERSAQIAAGPTGSVDAALDSVINTANDAGAALDGVAATYQRFSIAGNAAGLSQQTVSDIVNTTTRGFAVFTNTAGEASSAITQLSQAFSSGRLAGDEFRSVSENFPPLLQAISEVTGVATADLRDFAAEGNITSDVLIEAFRRLETQIEQLEGTVDQTLDQIINRLSNSFQLLVGEIDNATGASELFRSVLGGLNDALDISRLTNFGGTVEELREAIDRQTVAVAEAENSVGLYGFALNQVGFDIGGVGVETERLEALQAQLAIELQNSGDQALNAATSQIRLADAQNELTASVEQFNTVQQVSAQEIFNGLNAYEQLRAELLGLEIAFIASGSAAEESARLQGIAAAGIADFNTIQQLQAQEVFNSVDAFEALRAELLVIETRYAIAGDAVNEYADAQQILIDSINEVNTVQQLQAQEVFNSIDAYEALRAEIVQLEQDFQAIENITASFGEFLNLDTTGLENALANLSTLGLDLGEVFSGVAASIADALGVAENDVINATSGIFAVLNEFGIDVEEIFGGRVAQAISLFGAVTSEEFTGIVNVIDGAVGTIGGLFGGAAAGGGGGGGLSGIISGVGDAFTSVFGAGGSATDVSTALDGLVGPTQDLVAGATDASRSVEGLGTAVAATGQAAELSVGQLAATATAAAGIATAIADIAGFSAEGQAGAGVGAAAGAVIGGLLGGFGGAAVGGAAGGLLGGGITELLFGGDSEREAQRREAEQIGIALAEELTNGFAATFNDLASNLEADQLEAVFVELDTTVGLFNESLNQGRQNLVDLANERGVLDLAELIGVAFTTNLEAVSNASLLAADAISDNFQINIADTIGFFNTLPAGTADTFDQLQANATEIAQQLSAQFGLSVDEVVALFRQLGIDVEASLLSIDDAGEFLAARLADRFGVAVQDILTIFDTLPAGSLDSFSDIQNNAELVARNIAFSFGISFDEALAIVREFGVEAGVSLSDVGTTALDVGNVILEGFTGTSDQLADLFFNASRLILDDFENISVGADGTFSLIDERSQVILESLVEKFGGTSDDVQLILSQLAGNADISFGDIFTSGVVAFDGLSASGIASISEVLREFGLTAEQIANLFGGIADNGTSSFRLIEEQAAITLAAVLADFNLTGDEAEQILAAIAEAGGASFSDLEGAGGEALRELLAEFNLTEAQILAIFREIALGADSEFASVEGDGIDSADTVQAVFQQALEFLAGIFGAFQSSALNDLAGIAGGASSSALSIQQSFAGAASSAAGSLNRINQAANSANSAINAVVRRRREELDAARFAQGGLITGPVALTGGGAGRAFQFGGVLGGPTGIFGGGGGVDPTNSLGLAGEAGTEGIFPLTRVGGDLGVRALIPEDLISAIRGNTGGNTIIRENRIFLIRDASREQVDRLEERLLDIDASVESRSEAVVNEILDEATR